MTKSRVYGVASVRIDILTLFPDMFTGPFSESILKRAQEAGLVDIRLWNIRDYATDKHRQVDDTPFGVERVWSSSPSPCIGRWRR